MGRVLLIPLAVAIVVALFAAPALAGTVTVHGTVTDADGVPVKGADVTLFDADKTELTTAQSGADGSFAFKDVDVSTDYFSIRVFYKDARQSYTNADYLTDQYQARGDQSVPIKGTRLYMLHLTASSSANSSGPPLDPAGLSGAGAALALTLAAAMYLRKNA